MHSPPRYWHPGHHRRPRTGHRRRVTLRVSQQRSCSRPRVRGAAHRPGFSSAAQVRRRKLRLQNMSTGNTCGYISQSACVSMRGWGRRPVAFYYCIIRLHSPAYPISTSLALLSFSVKIGRMPTGLEERYTPQTALQYLVSVYYVWKCINIYIYTYIYILLLRAE